VKALAAWLCDLVRAETHFINHSSTESGWSCRNGLPVRDSSQGGDHV